jgi:hypothetical protein
LWVPLQCVAGLELRLAKLISASVACQWMGTGHSPIRFIQRFNSEMPLSKNPNCLRRYRAYNVASRRKHPPLLCPGPLRINQLASADAGAKMDMRRLATIGVCCCWALVTGDHNNGNGNMELQCTEWKLRISSTKPRTTQL